MAYRDDQGRLVELGEPLGAGGEGTVYRLGGDSKRCAKIYHPNKAAERRAKLQAMLACPPDPRLRGTVAWPTQLLFDDDAATAFAGFVMPAHAGLHELYRLLVPDERLQFAAFLSARDLCHVAAELARVLHGIHRAGHCVGDLKPQNVLVSPITGRIFWLDTDSFQICDSNDRRLHPSGMVTPEYTAPELFADARRTRRTPASDTFALAVLVHQILLGGAHPFDGDRVAGNASLERIPGRIRHGACPLLRGTTAVRGAASALSADILHPAIQELFERCFGPGHRDPCARPSALEWQRTLELAARALVRCRESSAHYYHASLSHCPWCERRARTGIDQFPASQGWQRGLALCKSPAKAPRFLRHHWFKRHVKARSTGRNPSKTERAWLLKAGAALGLEPATIRAILARPQRAPLNVKAVLAQRLRPLLRSKRPSRVACLVSLGLLGAAAAGIALLTSGAPAEEGVPRACAAPTQPEGAH